MNVPGSWTSGPRERDSKLILCCPVVFHVCLRQVTNIKVLFLLWPISGCNVVVAATTEVRVPSGTERVRAVSGAEMMITVRLCVYEKEIV